MVVCCPLDCRGCHLKIWDPAICREPSPIVEQYPCISIGDVGFLRNGQFHLLFSAARPLDDREEGVHVPQGFQQLILKKPPVPRDRLPPQSFDSTTIRKFEVNLGGTASADKCVPSLGSPSTHFKNVPPRLSKPSTHFTFELGGKRGASLITGSDTYRKDASSEYGVFMGYTKRHYRSWVEFSRSSGDVQPILVDGFDLTKDYTMVAYSNEDTYDCKLAFDIPIVAPVSGSIRGTWRTNKTPHTKSGPQERLPPHERATGPSSQPAEESATNEFNQCVFIRYYTMRWKNWVFREVIRAGAGPHDLGSGDSRGGVFPELTVRTSAESTTSDDEDPGGQWDHTTDDTGSDADIVVHNTPHVRFLQCSLIPALIFTFRAKGATTGTPLRITYSR